VGKFVIALNVKTQNFVSLRMRIPIILQNLYYIVVIF